MDSESRDACLCLSVESFQANDQHLKARRYITVLLVRRVWCINWAPTAPVTSLHLQPFVVGLLYSRSPTKFSFGVLPLLCPPHLVCPPTSMSVT